MPRLTARFPSCFFPAVCDLFPFDRLRGRNRGVFIVTIDLCTQFQVFPPFFFQFSSCFIILQTDLFCFIQCIIPLFFSIQCTLFHFFQFLLSLSFCLFKFPLHIFQYLKPIITDTDRFSTGGCQILRCSPELPFISHVFFLVKFLKMDISFSRFQLFNSGLCCFQPAQKCNVIISIRHVCSSRSVRVRCRL